MTWSKIYKYFIRGVKISIFIYILFMGIWFVAVSPWMFPQVYNDLSFAYLLPDTIPKDSREFAATGGAGSCRVEVYPVDGQFSTIEEMIEAIGPFKIDYEKKFSPWLPEINMDLFENDPDRGLHLYSSCLTYLSESYPIFTWNYLTSGFNPWIKVRLGGNRKWRTIKSTARAHTVVFAIFEKYQNKLIFIKYNI
ncbi:MAG: hypothetical protein ACPGOY_12335 [Rhodospirillaceae bacterium]